MALLASAGATTAQAAGLREMVALATVVQEAPMASAQPRVVHNSPGFEGAEISDHLEALLVVEVMVKMVILRVQVLLVSQVKVAAEVTPAVKKTAAQAVDY